MRFYRFIQTGFAGVLCASFLLQPVMPAVSYAVEQGSVGQNPEMPLAAELTEEDGQLQPDDPVLPLDDQAVLSDAVDSHVLEGLVEEDASKPVPGADGPVSPTNSSTHLDLGAEDFLTDEQIAEAQIVPADGTPRSTVSFAQLLVYAEQYLGLPYVWGGKHPSQGGFDCSGFVNWVFNNVAGTNINSNMTSAEAIYSRHCVPISEHQARPGDLVFWKYTYGSSRNYITHVGIYCGNGITLNAGDPIGYDPVGAVLNVNGQPAERVYGRMRGVTVTHDAPTNLQKLGKLHVPDAWHTGSALSPRVTVTVAGNALVQDRDFTVSYANNVNIGRAQVTVRGKGQYNGAITASFDIVDPKTAVANGVYEIVTALPGMRVLDVPAASKKPGELLQLYSSNGTGAQHFRVNRTPDGYYTLQNENSGLYLSSSSLMELGNRILVSQERADNTNRQKWMIKRSASGGYVISSAWDSRYVIDVSGANSSNGASIQMWESNGSAAQRWEFRRVQSMRSRLDDLASKNRGVLADGSYRLHTANSSSASLDVRNGGKANSTPVQLYRANGTAAQVWRVSHDEKGYVTLTGAGSGKALDVAGANGSQGAAVGIYDRNGTWAQKWVAVRDGSGVRLVSALDDSLVLDVQGGSTANGARVQLYGANGTGAQRWIFVKAMTPRERLDDLASKNRGVLADGSYRLHTANSSSASLDVRNGGKANSTPVQLYRANGTAAQVWRVSHDEKGYVTLTGAGSGKALDVAGANGSQGAAVGIYDRNGTWAQKWVAVRDGSGVRLVSALDDSLVLDVQGGSTANGARVQLYGANGTGAQRWTFVKTDDGVKAVGYSISLDRMIAINGLSSSARQFIDPKTWKLGDKAFYQFLDLRTGVDNVTGEQLDKSISSTALGRKGVFVGKGNAFVAAAKSAQINPMYLFAHSMIETGWGTSTMARGKYFPEGKVTIGNVTKTAPAGTYYNFFGWGAFDSSPQSAFDYARFHGWNSIEKSLSGAARLIADNYIYAGQETLYEMRWNPDYAEKTGKRSHQYATDPLWAYNIAITMATGMHLNGISGLGEAYLLPVYG